MEEFNKYIKTLTKEEQTLLKDFLLHLMSTVY